MRRETSPVLLPEQQRGLVDTNSLPHFLLDLPYLWDETQKFSPHLDLSFYTPYFKEMVLHDRKGYNFTDEQRASMLGNIQGDLPDDMTGFSESYKKLIHSESTVESMRTFYWDPEDGLIKASPINFGQVHSVESDAYDLLDDGKQPVLEAHTHPGGSLPSPQDYWPLITSPYKDNKSPYMNGIAVLCPDVIVLAFATRDTPVLPEPEAEVLVRDYNVNLIAENKERLDSLMQRQKMVIEKGINGHADVALHELNTMAHKVREMTADGKSDGEIHAFLEELHAKSDTRDRIISEKFRRVNGHAARQYGDLFHSTANRKLMEFARLIRVQLYHSYNGRDFLRASA